MSIKGRHGGTHELLESLEDIVGQLQRYKIGVDGALEVLGRIHQYYKAPRPYERLKKEEKKYRASVSDKYYQYEDIEQTQKGGKNGTN
jgi:hypothetical protein